MGAGDCVGNGGRGGDIEVVPAPLVRGCRGEVGHGGETERGAWDNCGCGAADGGGEAGRRCGGGGAEGVAGGSEDGAGNIGGGEKFVRVDRGEDRIGAGVGGGASTAGVGVADDADQTGARFGERSDDALVQVHFIEELGAGQHGGAGGVERGGCRFEVVAVEVGEARAGDVRHALVDEIGPEVVMQADAQGGGAASARAGQGDAVAGRDRGVAEVEVAPGDGHIADTGGDLHQRVGAVEERALGDVDVGGVSEGEAGAGGIGDVEAAYDDVGYTGDEVEIADDRGLGVDALNGLVGGDVDRAGEAEIAGDGDDGCAGGFGGGLEGCGSGNDGRCQSAAAGGGSSVAVRREGGVDGIDRERRGGAVCRADGIGDRCAVQASGGNLGVGE